LNTLVKVQLPLPLGRREREHLRSTQMLMGAIRELHTPSLGEVRELSYVKRQILKWI